MILALDVHYKANGLAKAVGVLFAWEDKEPSETIIDYTEGVADYVPGEFYKRELPCLLQLIKKVDLASIAAIIIDGYIYVDNEYKYGLGGILWDKLHHKIPIVGVAKTSFLGNKETVKEIYRGQSKKPLFVSAIGCELGDVIEKIASMHGNYRVPDVLKKLDTITKEESD